MKGLNKSKTTLVALIAFLQIFVTTQSIAQCQDMACLGQVNISLDTGCTALVTPDMLVADDSLLNFDVRVVITTMDDDSISDGAITSEYAGMTLKAKLVCGSNSCWSLILIEDKLAPVISTDTIEMQCWELQEFVPNTNDCSTTTATAVGNPIVTNLDCNIYAQEVKQSFIATDTFGNQSEITTLVINILTPNLDSVIFPTDKIQDMALACNRYPDALPPDSLGYPKLNRN